MHCEVIPAIAEGIIVITPRRRECVVVLAHADVRPGKRAVVDPRAAVNGEIADVGWVAEESDGDDCEFPS